MNISGLKLEKRNDGIALLVFDVPGESVNTLRAEFADELDVILDQVERDERISALVLTSAKRDSFIAGADISMIARATTAEVAAHLSERGQRAVERLENLRVPAVAAIHGACLGGGLELSLACAARVATSHEKTAVGLPEVQLGILPGMGGTQRLPHLIGLTAALDLLLTGRKLDARRALKIGLVDEVVPESILIPVAIERALQLAEKRGKKEHLGGKLRERFLPNELREMAMTENPLGRKVVFDQARKTLREKTHGNYPAPERILDVVKRGLERGHKAGLEAEAEAFGELVMSEESRALRHIYFSQQSLKKDASAPVETRATKVGVLGAGLMGAGVALVSVLQADATVRLKDVREDGLARGLKAISTAIDAQVKKRRLTEREKVALMARVTATTDMSLLGSPDVVIEAVFEDLALKRRVLAEVESLAGERTIFASNTSSLPIGDIAAEARHPERVIGMHYFSPVEKMPLLEIITTDVTADWVRQTCVDLGRRQGKTVIVVGDGPGFYTTRILGPYLNEAAYALVEGVSVQAIDAELVQAGFPVGPLALLDEIGIDVGTKVVHTLVEAFGERLAAPPALSRMLQSSRLGRKSKKGFYEYTTKYSGKRPVDETVYGDLGLPKPSTKKTRPGGIEEPDSVAERCILAMVNEAVHCLGEGILRSPRDGDVGAIFGLGFPPFLGGPFHFIDRKGAPEILGRLQRLEKKHGARFAPAPLLLQGKRFYPDGA